MENRSVSTHAHEVQVDAGRGPVRVRLPAGLQTSPRAAGWPLVIYLHGYASGATDFEVHFGVSGRHSESEVQLGHRPPEESEDQGMIEVLANGRVDSQGNRYWAAWGDWVGDCRPSSPSDASYQAYDEASLSTEDYWQLGLEHCGATDADVLYLRNLVAAVALEVPVDPQHIAVLGHSNGAALAYRLACEADDLFRAVVAISGSPPPDESAVGCRPARPTRILHVHGTDDSVVLYGGRKGAYDGAVASVERFLAYNNCSTRQLPTGASLPGWSGGGAPGADGTSELDLSRRVAGLDTEVWRVSDCASGGDVTLWKVVGEQHTPLMWRGAPTTHEGAYQREVRRWLLQQPDVATRRPPRTHDLDGRGGVRPGSSAHHHAPTTLIVMAMLCVCFACCCVCRRRRLSGKLDTLRLLTSVAVDVACSSSAPSHESAAAAPAAAVQLTAPAAAVQMTTSRSDGSPQRVS